MSALDPSDAGCITTLLEDQRRSWRSGQRMRAEEFAERVGPNAEALLTLVYQEMTLRQEDGETLVLEEYLDRFPQFAVQLHERFNVLQHLLDLDTIDQIEKASAEVSPSSLPEIGDYEVLAEVGRGSMGVVYKGRQLRPDRLVALKMILAGEHASPQSVRRFLSEAEAVARLQHPGIVQIFEVGQQGPLPYISLEWVEGGSLGARLAAKPLTAAEAAGLVAALAEAVHHAHLRGVIHRDLKPTNVLLTPSGQPKITDFGLAKRLDGEPGLTASGAVLGTPSYMAPEQAAGQARDVGPPADIYALGVLLYECLTGRPPFRTASAADTLLLVIRQEPVPPRQLQPRVPRDLETICLKCLEKEPARRYGSGQELADDLVRFQQGRPIYARPVSRVEKVWRWGRRNPALAAMTGLAAAALAAVLVLSIGFAMHQAQALKKAQLLSASLAFDQGLTLCEQGDAGRGMLWLGRALQIAPEDAHDLRRVIRINLGAWGRQLTPLHAILPHSDPVQGLAVSPDGSHVVTVAGKKTAFLWQTAGPTFLGEAFGHDEVQVTAVACSRDVPVLLTGSASLFRAAPATARLWDLDSRQPLETPRKLEGMVYAVALSPDGQTLLTGNHNNRAYLWRRTASQPIILPHDGEVRAVAFGPDGKMVATGSADKHARVWDGVTGQLIGKPLSHPDTVLAVAFSPDGRLLATGCIDGKVRLWEAANGKTVGSPLAHPSVVGTVTFRRDGKTVLTGCFDGQARLWDLATGRAWLAPLAHEGEVTAVALAEDDKAIWTASNDRLVRQWRMPTDRPPRRLVHQGTMLDAAFSPDGWLAVTGGLDHTARLTDVASGETLHVLRHPHCVGQVAFSPDGKTLLTGADDGIGRLWDVFTGRCRAQLPHTARPLYAIAFDPHGRFVVTGGMDKTTRVWDATTGAALTPPLEHGATVRAVAISPDGQTVLTGSDDRTARLWNATTGQARTGLLAHDALLSAVVFSPDGRLACTASSDGAVRIWDVATGQLRVGPLHHRGYVNTVAFAPGGNVLATAGQDRVVRLWDPATGQPAGPSLPHQGRIYSVAFSHDGKFVLTGSHDKTARLWDAVTGKALGPALDQQPFVCRVALGPDGKAFLTAGAESAQLGDLPLPLTGEPDHIVLWLEVRTGLELSSDNVIRGLDADAWTKRARRLEERGAPPGL
jgi:WD40 repeat protein